jgi:hypothetical protein
LEVFWVWSRADLSVLGTNAVRRGRPKEVKEPEVKELEVKELEVKEPEVKVGPKAYSGLPEGFVFEWFWNWMWLEPPTWVM